MNRKEAERQTRQLDALRALGFTHGGAESLRRISMTLQRWHALEFGDSDDCGSWAIERDGDEPDSKPYRVWHGHRENRTVRTPIPDRETGARKRLAAIVDRCNKARLASTTAGVMTPREGLRFYIQTDPRGAALYIIRPGDIPAGESVESCYSRGLCVY
jgi:hypothetical protein